MKLVCSCFLVALLLCGCGKNESLEKYYDEMNSFTEDIQKSFNVLNSIDPSSENAVEEMLSVMNSLSDSFQILAEIDVPDEFLANESLADEAASYMKEAAVLYAETYSGDSYNESIAEAAQENYNRAVKRLNYISQILQGEMPEDESVTVITEDTDLSGE